MKQFIVNKNENGIRLDNYIKLKIKASFSFLQMMERKKLVRVNKIHPKDYKVILKENDEISFYLNDDLFIHDEIVKPNFTIIYEDKNLLVVDKDKHVRVHGENINDHESLVDYVSTYLIKKHEYIPSIKTSFKPAVVTRLDTNTEGLVLIAKNREYLNRLNKEIENNNVTKIYHTVVKGTFDNKHQVLKDYCLIDENKSINKIIKNNIEGSKEIVTEYNVIKEFNNISFIEVILHTGKLHQIRAHLSFYNHPVLGDNKYGDKQLNKIMGLNNQTLICKKIILPSDLIINNSVLLSETDNKVVLLSKKEVKTDFFLLHKW